MIAHFVTCRKLKSDGSLGSDVGDIRFLEVPAGAPSPLAVHEKYTAGSYESRVRRYALDIINNLRVGDTQVTSGNIVFIVHGYNVSADHSLAFHRKIEAHLTATGFTGQFISFDWPSDGVTLEYLDDLGKMRATAIKLVNQVMLPFVSLQQPDCDVQLHIIAHSMGAYLLANAFHDSEHNMTLKTQSWIANQVVLVSGDAPATIFTEGDSLSNALYLRSQRLTNYQNAGDAVLQVSNAKRLFTSSRVGRVGLPDIVPASAINVDATNLWMAAKPTYRPGDQFVESHTFWFDDQAFYVDLRYTLEGELDRNAIPGRLNTGKNRFSL